MELDEGRREEQGGEDERVQGDLAIGGREECRQDRMVRRGDRIIYDLLAFMLDRIRSLAGEPTEETAMFKRVRQSGKYLVWRISHPYESGIALRLICWFPPDTDTIVVALFAGEKSNMGDVFYDTVGVRADRAIERWLAEMEES